MDALRFLFVGYVLSVAIETPVLLIGLSRRHSIRRRLFAGFWLTACTYPIVVLVIPVLLDRFGSRALVVACDEVFAAVAECALFQIAFGQPGGLRRWSAWYDMGIVALANLASFGGGEALRWLGWLR